MFGLAVGLYPLCNISSKIVPVLYVFVAGLIVHNNNSDRRDGIFYGFSTTAQLWRSKDFAAAPLIGVCVQAQKGHRFAAMVYLYRAPRVFPSREGFHTVFVVSDGGGGTRQ